MTELKTISRFLSVGAAAATCEYALFFVLHRQLHAALLVANSLSFLLGFSISFSLNRIWAFNTDADFRLRMRAQLGFYAGLASVNLLLSNVLIAFMHVLGLGSLMSKLVTMALIAVWNYVIMKLFIFSEKLPGR